MVFMNNAYMLGVVFVTSEAGPVYSILYYYCSEVIYSGSVYVFFYIHVVTNTVQYTCYQFRICIMLSPNT